RPLRLVRRQGADLSEDLHRLDWLSVREQRRAKGDREARIVWTLGDDLLERIDGGPRRSGLDVELREEDGRFRAPGARHLFQLGARLLDIARLEVGQSQEISR